MLRFPPSRTVFCLCFALAWPLSACGGDVRVSIPDLGGGGDAGPPGDPPSVIYSELVANGMLDYEGMFPAQTSSSGGIAQHTWDPQSDNGPRCIGNSDPDTERFTIITQDRGGENLLIFLQGGGLCSSLTPGACERAGIPYVPLGILSADATNPFREYNLGYVPYCDGSLFLGDTTNELDGSVLEQRGRQNLTSTLDVLRANFPNPRRIALVGISAGAFSTIFAGPLVRLYFPESELLVVNDSGIGITRGSQELEFVDDVLAEFEADHLVPESCTECFSDGHAIRFVEWILDRDPQLRVANISHVEDDVIANGFLAVGFEFFRTELERETAALSARFPGRYHTYLIEGAGHTALLVGEANGEGDVGEIFDWLQLFSARDPAWGDVVQPGSLTP